MMRRYLKYGAIVCVMCLSGYGGYAAIRDFISPKYFARNLSKLEHTKPVKINEILGYTTMIRWLIDPNFPDDAQVETLEVFIGNKDQSPALHINLGNDEWRSYSIVDLKRSECKRSGVIMYQGESKKPSVWITMK